MEKDTYKASGIRKILDTLEMAGFNVMAIVKDESNGVYKVEIKDNLGL
jgi:hypothetical protein